MSLPNVNLSETMMDIGAACSSMRNSPRMMQPANFQANVYASGMHAPNTTLLSKYGPMPLMIAVVQ